MEMNLNGNIKELFANKVYLRNLLIVIFVWSFSSFAFFLVPFYVSTINIGNVYYNFLFSEVAEFFANILVLYVVNVMSLKNSITLFSFVVLIGSICMTVLIKIQNSLEGH